jgi:hypothetical protein
MRNLKLTIALAAAAACVLGCIASSALAGEFAVSHEGAATRGTSGTAGAQEFEIGPFDVVCSAVRSTGTATWQVLYNSLKLSHCEGSALLGGEPISLKASVKGRVEVAYAATEDGGPISALPSSFTIALKTIKCTIDVAGGGSANSGVGAGKASVGSASVENLQVPTDKLKTFPTGLQSELFVDAEITNFAASFAGGCGGLQPIDDGSYSGGLWVSVPAGNLRYNPSDGSEEGWNRVKNKQEGEVPGI